MGAGLDGGVVISLRGGDFELTVGQDFSIGYLDHDAERVRLYIEESFTFLILTAQAAIPLTGRRQEALTYFSLNSVRTKSPTAACAAAAAAALRPTCGSSCTQASV